MRLVENLDYHDLVGQVIPTLSIDEYEAKAGSNDEIITLAFKVVGKAASTDLVDWFERGYEWILDAQVSEGEYTAGRYLVFVEIERRTKAVERIVELIDDLETLTNMSLADWTVTVDGSEYGADISELKGLFELSPHSYRESNPEDTEEDEEDEKENIEPELNEMRRQAGLEPAKMNKQKDSLLKDFIAKAGL
jgi:hypothetical protein